MEQQNLNNQEQQKEETPKQSRRGRKSKSPVNKTFRKINKLGYYRLMQKKKKAKIAGRAKQSK